MKKSIIINISVVKIDGWSPHNREKNRTFAMIDGRKALRPKHWKLRFQTQTKLQNRPKVLMKQTIWHKKNITANKAALTFNVPSTVLSWCHSGELRWKKAHKSMSLDGSSNPLAHEPNSCRRTEGKRLTNSCCNASTINYGATRERRKVENTIYRQMCFFGKPVNPWKTF